MKISIIVAAAENNAIGRNNELLCYLPYDLKFFKSTTWGSVVAMGRKTFESLGNKTLPGRTNVIITRNADWQFEGTRRASSIEEAMVIAHSLGYKELFIAGGGDIYRQALPLANIIYITRIHATLEGDTFFPEFSEKEWTKKQSTAFFKDEKHAFDFTVEKWERNSIS